MNEKEFSKMVEEYLKKEVVGYLKEIIPKEKELKYKFWKKSFDEIKVSVLSEEEESGFRVFGVTHPNGDIKISSRLTEDGWKHTANHEFFHVVEKRLCPDLRELPDKKKYPFAFSLWKSLVVVDNKSKIGYNFIAEGMANFFAGVQMSKDGDEIKEERIPAHIFYEFFKSLRVDIEERYPDLLVKALAINSDIINVYFLLYQLNGAENEEKDRENINKIKDKIKIHRIGEIITLFIYEKYKREGKKVEDVLKDFISSPQKIVDDLVREIKKDEDKSLLKEALFDISKSTIEYLIPNFYNFRRTPYKPLKNPEPPSSQFISDEEKVRNLLEGIEMLTELLRDGNSFKNMIRGQEKGQEKNKVK